MQQHQFCMSIFHMKISSEATDTRAVLSVKLNWNQIFCFTWNCHFFIFCGCRIFKEMYLPQVKILEISFQTTETFCFNQEKNLSLKLDNSFVHCTRYIHTYCVSTSIKNKENVFFKEKNYSITFQEAQNWKLSLCFFKRRHFCNVLCFQWVRILPEELFLLASFQSALVMRPSRQDTKRSWFGLLSYDSVSSHWQYASEAVRVCTKFMWAYASCRTDATCSARRAALTPLQEKLNSQKSLSRTRL